MILPSLQSELVKQSATRPIYITGVPRCGSSWVGEVLGGLPRTRYVYEPFNLQWVPTLRGELSYFRYLEAGDAVSGQIAYVADRAHRGGQGWKQLARAVYRGYSGSSFLPFDNVVIKDPTAPLLCEWIVHRYSAHPVVIVRHPCGFASSVDQLSWEFDLDYFLRQRKLMRRHLGIYEHLLRRCKNDVWMTRAAVWAAIHKVLLAQSAAATNSWTFCRYEEICLSPGKELARLAKRLGLEWSASAADRLESRSGKHSVDPGSTSKDSQRMHNIWRERLSPAQIDTVLGVCDEFGLSDYPGPFERCSDVVP